jgi:uncharacterized lipoprotein YmbA
LTYSIAANAFWRKRLDANLDTKLSWLDMREPGHRADAAPLQVLMDQWQQRF